MTVKLTKIASEAIQTTKPKTTSEKALFGLGVATTSAATAAFGWGALLPFALFYSACYLNERSYRRAAPLLQNDAQVTSAAASVLHTSQEPPAADIILPPADLPQTPDIHPEAPRCRSLTTKLSGYGLPAGPPKSYKNRHNQCFAISLLQGILAAPYYADRISSDYADKMKSPDNFIEVLKELSPSCREGAEPSGYVMQQDAQEMFQAISHSQVFAPSDREVWTLEVLGGARRMLPEQLYDGVRFLNTEYMKDGQAIDDFPSLFQHSFVSSRVDPINGRVQRRDYLSTAPEQLVICMKRYQTERVVSRWTRRVNFEVHARKNRVTGIEDILTVPKDYFLDETGASYRLDAVVMHHGKTATSGHYTACVRRYDPGTQEDLFYECNDARITLIDHKTFLAAAETGYILRFTKIPAIS